MIMLEADPQAINWGGVIIQGLITLGVVFGGAGFWDLVKTKFLTKHEDKKNDAELGTNVVKLSNQMSDLITVVHGMNDNISTLKSDVALLQKANEVTVEYRKSRDEQDKIQSAERAAVIQALKDTMRSRLLDFFERCRDKGYYTVEERDVYHPLYECYKSDPFGGNGVIDDLHDKLVQLPTTEEEVHPKIVKSTTTTKSKSTKNARNGKAVR